MSYSMRTIGDGHAETHVRYNETDQTRFPIGTVYSEIQTRHPIIGRRGSTFLTLRRLAVLLTIARNPAVIGDDETVPLKSNPSNFSGSGGLLKFASIGTRIATAIFGIDESDNAKTEYHSAIDNVTPDQSATETVQRIAGSLYNPPTAKPADESAPVESAPVEPSATVEPPTLSLDEQKRAKRERKNAARRAARAAAK